jgi:hypothetical protein
MPQLATPITDAIDGFKTNEYILGKALPSITPEESLLHPAPNSNHALWIFGHILYCRLSVLKFLGRYEGQNEDRTRPWLHLFKRGATREDASAYPAWSDLHAAWQEITPILHQALEEATDELLDQPAPEGVPSADKKISGVVRFFVLHEMYHIGQIGYLSAWLGRKGPVG